MGCQCKWDNTSKEPCLTNQGQDIVGTVAVLWAFCLCFIDCYKDCEDSVIVDA